MLSLELKLRLTNMGMFRGTMRQLDEEWAPEELRSTETVKNLADILRVNFFDHKNLPPTAIGNSEFFLYSFSRLLLQIILAAAFYPYYFMQTPIDSRVAAQTVPYGDPQLTLEVKFNVKKNLLVISYQKYKPLYHFHQNFFYFV